MATISMCDRCQNMGVREALGAIVYQLALNDTDTQDRLELCPTCIGDFVMWKDDPSVERRARVPFRHPYREPEPDRPAITQAQP